MIKYQPIQAKSMLVPSGDEWFLCAWNLNTYRGCFHNCNYCYARAHKYLIHSKEEEFGQTIFVKESAPQILRKELTQLSRKGKKGIICFNSASDPYQPCESKYKISKKVLEVIAEYGFLCHVMTKSDLILRDLDLLKEISKKAWCAVSFTLTTLNENLVKLLEPKAPEPENRLRAMRLLSKNGILTGTLFMPIIPHLTDNEENLETIIAKSKENGAKYVIPSSFTLRDVQRERFFKLLKENFPELIEKYKKMYGNRQSPNKKYVYDLMNKVEKICKKYKIATEIPGPKTKRVIQTRLNF